MKTVVFNIQTLDAALADFGRAWKSGKKDGTAQIGFQSWELMHKGARSEAARDHSRDDRSGAAEHS